MLLRRLGFLAWLALGPLAVAYLGDPVLGAGLARGAVTLFGTLCHVRAVLSLPTRRSSGRRGRGGRGRSW